MPPGASLCAPFTGRAASRYADKNRIDRASIVEPRGLSSKRLGVDPLTLRAITCLTIGLLLPASLARAEPVSTRYQGAGGPFVSVTRFWLPSHGNRSFMTYSFGGAGYSYYFDGWLRLGGGGQNSFTSDEDGDFSSELTWGGLSVGIDPLRHDTWELPLTLVIGGGSYRMERVVHNDDGVETIERRGGVIMMISATAGAEMLVLRTIKLAFEIGYAFGLTPDLELHGLTAHLQIVFMIPGEGT